GLRYAKRNCGMKQGKELRQGRVEWSRQEWRTSFEVGKVRGRNQFVPQGDMMASRAPEACRMPSIVDLPLTRGKLGSQNLRLSCVAENRLAVGDRNAEPRDPVDVLASTREWPASAHKSLTRTRFLSRSCRLRGTTKNHVGAVLINVLVGLPRQKR